MTISIICGPEEVGYLSIGYLSMAYTHPVSTISPLPFCNNNDFIYRGNTVRQCPVFPVSLLKYVHSLQHTKALKVTIEN